MSQSKKLRRPDGETIAYRMRAGNASRSDQVGIIWMGGFNSDMTGTKASALDDWAVGAKRRFFGSTIRVTVSHPVSSLTGQSVFGLKTRLLSLMNWPKGPKF